MVYYVATNGKDCFRGTCEEPFASIERARDAVRDNIREGLREPVTVKILSGVYKTGNIMFDERDSGTAAFPVTYEAEGEVVLNGGIRLSADLFEPLMAEEKNRLSPEAACHVVRTNLRRLGFSREDWGEMCVTGSHHTGDRYDGAILSPIACELFVNGNRQTVARYPNEGFLYTTGAIREGDGLESKLTGKVIYNYTLEEWAQKRNPLSDIFEIDEETAKRTASWKSLQDVWMFGYPAWNWAGMSTPVVRIGAEDRSMETKMVSRYGIKRQMPYYLYNIFEELDKPGEWYLDRDSGWLYLYPDCDLSEAEIDLSLLTESLLTVKNASYIRFKGLTFTATRGDALTLFGDHLSLENCVIQNVAGYAAVIEGNYIHVSGCEMYHLGRGGVMITGGDRASLTPSHNVLENNHIHHFSEIFTTYQPGFSLCGVGNLCRNNCIHDSTHMAIYFEGNDHIVEYNEIYDVCKTADDSSAVYAGRDYTVQGTVIRFNYFHDIKSVAKNDVGIFAVYCDDNLGKCTITNNVFERCQSALLLHGGHEMAFRGNVIIDACPKSKNSLNFSKYYYGDDLIGNGLHVSRLAAVPWQSDVWKRAYPGIEKYLSWDPLTEQIYPHFCDLSNNVIINHCPFEINFPWYKDDFQNRVEHNMFLENLPACDTKRLCGEFLPSAVEGFEAIPMDRIGIIK